MLDVQAARQELESKSLLDIERATAITWGGRAAACYDLAFEARDPAMRQRRLEEAQSYRQEALEHAAMTEDLAFVRDVLDAIVRHQRAAGSTTPSRGSAAGA